MKPTVYIIDASPIFYKAFFAVPSHLASKSGIPTNAVYGFMSSLIKLLKTYDPKHIVICFDNRSNFRKEIFEGYKEDRKPMDNRLSMQIPVLKDIIKIMGIPLVEKSGYEADDLIGMLAKWSEAQGANAIIVSPDKDMAQLVNENVKVLYDLKEGLFMETNEVTTIFGVPPNKIVDLLALSGDTVDGIPGVMGIGGKTAVKLIQQYGSVEDIYANISSIKGSLKEKLEKNKEMAFISKQLATIITEWKLDFEVLLDVERGFIQQEQLRSKFDALNFASLQKRLDDL